jgi:hypothetical protein
MHSYPLRLVALTAVAALVAIGLGAGARVFLSARVSGAQPEQHGWSRLPVPARTAVSRGLGASDRAYWLYDDILRNPAQGLRATGKKAQKRFLTSLS